MFSANCCFWFNLNRKNSGEFKVGYVLNMPTSNYGFGFCFFLSRLICAHSDEMTYSGTLVLVSNWFWKMCWMLKSMGTEKTTWLTTWPVILAWRNSKSWGHWHQQVLPCTSTTRRKMSAGARFLLQNTLNTEFNKFWRSQVPRYDCTGVILKAEANVFDCLLEVNSGGEGREIWAADVTLNFDLVLHLNATTDPALQIKLRGIHQISAWNSFKTFTN